MVYTNQILSVPKWASDKPILFFFITFVACMVFFSSYILPWYFVMTAIVEVTVFFFCSKYLSKKWSVIKMPKVKDYEKNLFIWSSLIRVVGVLILYAVFQVEYNDPFGFENGDATYYDLAAKTVRSMINESRFNFYEQLNAETQGKLEYSDCGFPIYLGFVYYLTGGSILLSRIIKCFISAFTVILIYRLASRNFGEQVGRLTGIFVMLMPQLWYYCTAQLKETEMVFLFIFFIEQADQMIRTRNFSAWKVAPLLLLAGAMFAIRTALALVMVIALLFTFTMISTRVVSWGKRIIVGLLVVALVGVTMGNSIKEQAKELTETAQSDKQEQNMAWRTTRENGNQFAKYASATVFAPLIFTIPFPTFVDTPQQEVVKIVNGANYVKNILSGIVIFTMFALLLTGKWREHVLPLSAMLGYLLVLVMSEFAQSGRFHLPILPLELMFAAYGMAYIQAHPKRKRFEVWFMVWCAFIMIACLGWQWFKLRGRGM